MVDRPAATCGSPPFWVVGQNAFARTAATIAELLTEARRRDRLGAHDALAETVQTRMGMRRVNL